MKTLLIIIHVCFGFLALTVGLVPMLSKKGGRLHKTTGLIYYWSMIVVAASAVALVLISPFSNGRLFLTGIAIFSFYLCYTGNRSLKQRDGEPVRWFDWSVSGIMTTGAIGMILYGLFQMSNNWSKGQFDPMSALFVLFGFFSFTNARYDFKKYRFPEKARYWHKEWFFMHIIRICGSYIATFTAFALVNIRYVFPDSHWVVNLLTWVMPGVVGGIFIGRTVRMYLSKFNMSVNKDESRQ